MVMKSLEQTRQSQVGYLASEHLSEPSIPNPLSRFLARLLRDGLSANSAIKCDLFFGIHEKPTTRRKGTNLPPTPAPFPRRQCPTAS